jgi:predicted nuclease of restriction endonuclease-like (RecB) superfamily
MEEIKSDIVMNGKQEDVLFKDACVIIEQAQVAAYRAVDVTLIKRNWLLGMRIQHDVLKDKRAEYGEQIIENLALKLTIKYGKGFIKRNLHHFVDFFVKYPDFFYAVSGKSDTILSLMGQSDDSKIVNAVSSQLPVTINNIGNAVSSQSSIDAIFQSLTRKNPIRLTWTHYRIILQENSKEARDWYEQEATREMWGTRTLQRNVSSQYYHRLLQSQKKDAVHDEMVKLTRPLQDRLEHLKNPVVAEFLGFKNNTDYTESDLEQSIIDHLIPFLMEMGKGFALVDRQKRIHTEKEDYYIDLVFYNYNLRSFVLVDLKTTKLRHQDVGQMDMYVRMYDEMMCPQGHNPTIGLLLCADTDEDVAHYSMLNGSDQLFAAKYLTYMPTKDELRREIEQQKEFFQLQQK